MNEHINYFLLVVNSMDEVEKLRQIRNECRSFMTRNKNEISKQQQLDWYNLLDKGANKLYLLHKTYHGVANYGPIGYGVIKIEPDCVLLTGGLLESERNGGVGSILFSLLVNEARQFTLPIKLEVLKTNVRAKTVYERLGFNVVLEDDKVIYMELNDE